MKPDFHKVNLPNSIWTIRQQYQQLQYLGCGTFGQVCSAHDQNTNTTIAIKKISQPFLSPEHAKRVYREVKLLQHMDHENIIKILDVFTPSEDCESFSEIYLVSQLMDRDLKKLFDLRIKLTDTQVKLIIYQILRALKYIHSGGIMHRDLKPSNIAINDNFEIRILDFGLSRQINQDNNVDFTPYVVARSYRAPEILFNWMHYNQNVDVWSVGCIFGEILCGKVLFVTKDSIEHINSIFKLVGTPDERLLMKMTSQDACNYIKRLPIKPKQNFRDIFHSSDDNAIDLLEKLLDLDPDTRISTTEALAHPYFSSLSDPSDEPELQPFDSSFENDPKDLNTWKQLLFNEIRK